MLLELRMLGGFGVRVDGREIPAARWTQRRAAELVQVLALTPSNRAAREQLIEVLWPTLEPSAGAANLHKAAHYARAALGARDALVLRGGSVILAPDGDVVVDAVEFEGAADAALVAGDRSACLSAASVYGGELLPDDRYADWAAASRERLHDLYLRLLRRGGLWERLLAEEPGDEHAHREVMRAHAAAGHRHAALRQYRRLVESGTRPGEETTSLYEALSFGPAAVAPVCVTTRLIGRRAELRRARAAWEGAARGQGTTVLIRGDAGIGKTRLAEELLSEAVVAGWSTLRGTAHEDQSGLPYAPVTEALDRLLEDRPELALAIPDRVQPGLAVLTTAALVDRSPPTSPVGRMQVFAAAAQVLASLARERGVVFLIDDVHAADAGTLELVQHLARAARFHRVLLLLTFREPPRESLAALRTGLLDRGAASEIELLPLTAEESDELLTLLTGRQLPRETLDAVYSLAGGNPFFTEELASSATAVQPVQVPSQLLDVVDARLSRLAASTRAALETVAVVTSDVDARTLGLLCQITEPKAFAVLDEALASGVLVERADRCRFRHGLLRAALMRGVPAHRRAAAHSDAADRLAAAGAPAAQVAHQLLEAGLGERAVSWLVEASRDAAAMGAFTDAHRLASRALEFAPDDPEVIELRADLAVTLGDPDAAAAYSPALASLPDQHADDVRVKQAYAYFISGDLPRARETLSGVGPVSAASRARLLITRGWLAVFSGNLDRAAEVGVEARALAGELGLTAELFEASMLEAFVTLNRGEWPERLRSDLLDPTHAPEIAGMLHEAHLCVAQVFLYGGLPYEEVIAGARGLAAAAERAGARRGIAFATTLLGEAELLSGYQDRAEGHLTEGVRRNREVGGHGGEALCLWRLAELALARDRREEALPLLERAYAAATPSWLCIPHMLCRVHGTLIRAAVDPAAAVAAVADGETAMATRSEWCNTCSPHFLLPAATALATAGAPTRAQRYADRAARVISVLWGDRGSWPAALAEARGAIARAGGDETGSRELLAEAAGRFAAAGQPLDAARCRDAAILPARVT
jgi:DNA-binding SARP family transcriptional activator/tetratricopeptide (TPR) repeat protein